MARTGYYKQKMTKIGYKQEFHFYSYRSYGFLG